MSGHVHCCDEVDAEAAWGAGYNAGRFDREAEARAEPRAEGLDVELEAAAILLAKVIESMRKNDPAIFAAVLPHIHAFLDAYAREYAALEEPTP